MDISEEEILVVKYLNGQTDQEETELLNEWIEDPKNRMIFDELIKTHYIIDHDLKTYDSQSTKKRLLKKIQSDRSMFAKSKRREFLKYAAIFISVLGLAFYFHQNKNGPQEYPELTPGDEPITLQLEDGSLQHLNLGDNRSIINKEGAIISKQSASTLTYDSKRLNEVMKYNILKVPNGKRFQVVLSDGTEVFLNAGTILRYPVSFVDGQERQVFLKGEAFFKVVKDARTSFLVNSEELKIQVLGTEFNVTSYPENKEIDVVLVRGSVGLFTESEDFDAEKDVVLVPGEMAIYDKEVGSIETREVVTGVYTSWISGDLVFRNMKFSDMLEKMERHYNISIINKNLPLAEVEFNAAFGDEPIHKVLFYLQENYGIEYSIENNQVIIN